MGSPPPSPPLSRKPLINRQIRSSEVRVIDDEGKQLGVMSLEKALRLAWERNLDLIQVTEKTEPPVCKIMDQGKYLYQQKKKERKSRSKGGELKGLRLGFNISQHDLETRIKQAEKFLKKGDKIKIEIRLKGRERALESFAREKIDKFLEILGKHLPYKVERELKKEIQGLTMIIAKKE